MAYSGRFLKIVSSFSMAHSPLNPCQTQQTSSSSSVRSLHFGSSFSVSDAMRFDTAIALNPSFSCIRFDREFARKYAEMSWPGKVWIVGMYHFSMICRRAACGDQNLNTDRRWTYHCNSLSCTVRVYHRRNGPVCVLIRHILFLVCPDQVILRVEEVESGTLHDCVPNKTRIRHRLEFQSPAYNWD